jgi:hypothetical protein
MKKIFNKISILFVVCSTWACTEELIPPMTSQATTRIQMAHVSPSVDPTRNVEFYTADVSFGNNNRKANLAYGATAATNPSAGSVFLKTRLNDVETPIFSGTFSADDYGYYTALLANVDGNNMEAAAPIGLAMLKDNLAAPQEGSFKVRIVNFGIGAGNVDVYLYTGTTQTEAVATLGYAKAHPGNASLSVAANSVSQPVEVGYQSLPAGQYQIRVRPAGADPASTPIATGAITFAGQRCYTLVIRGYREQPTGLSGRILAIQSILHERVLY